MHLQKEPETLPPMSNEGFRRMQVRYSEDSTVVRHLFAKQFSLMYHKQPSSSTIKKSGDQNLKPENRTLLLVNVPPFVTEHHLRFLFSEKRCGCRLERIFIQEKPSAGRLASLYNQIQTLKGGDEEGEAMETDDQSVKSVTSFFGGDEQQHIGHYKVAYVVFQSPGGLERALEMATSDEVFSLKPPTSEGGDVQKNFLTGIRLWQHQYNQSVETPPWQAKKTAEAYLADFHRRAEEAAEREKRLAAKRGAGLPDAEGWTTVNRKVNRRDKTALVSSQFFDRKIKEKYDGRAKKRQQEEAAFEEAVKQSATGSSMLETGKRKKRKGGRFNAVDFLKDGGGGGGDKVQED